MMPKYRFTEYLSIPPSRLAKKKYHYTPCKVMANWLSYSQFKVKTYRSSPSILSVRHLYKVQVVLAVLLKLLSLIKITGERICNVKYSIAKVLMLKLLLYCLYYFYIFKYVELMLLCIDKSKLII